MTHGVIVGRIVEATAERLQFIDGTEFTISGRLPLADLTSGTTVKLVYQVVKGLKIPVGITVLPDRRSRQGAAECRSGIEDARDRH